MKRILDFILSFVVPSKIKRYRNLNIFLIVLIFLGCSLLCAGVSNLSLERYVKRNKENFRLFSETYDLPSGNEKILPKFTLDESTFEIEDFAGENLYETTFDLEDGSKLNLTLVYEPNVYINDLEETPYDDRIINFNIVDYYNYVPERDANGKLKEKDMLVIITAELIYYFNNHGYDLYQSADGTYTRYLEATGWSIMEKKCVLPKDESEIVYTDETNKTLDYSKWTESAKLGDTKSIGGKTYVAYNTQEDAYYLPATSSEVNSLNSWSLSCDKDGEITHNGVVYKAKTKISRNLHNVFISDATQRIGVFSLYQASKLGINFGDLSGDGKATTDMKLVVEAIGNLMVNMGVSQLSNYNTIYAIIFIVILPLLWTFGLWMMSRKFGELTRVKEYYAICSVSYIFPSVLVALFTIVAQPYAFIAQYAMFVQLAFYIFMVYKINNPKTKKTNNDSGNSRELPVVDLKVETKKVTEIKSQAAQME